MGSRILPPLPHDIISLVSVAAGAIVALALALLGARRRPGPGGGAMDRAPRRAVFFAIVIALALAAVFKAERGVLTPLDLEGGTVLVYEVDRDRAIADERDRRFEELRDRAATALGAHEGAGSPTANELRRLRERVRIDRPRDQGDAIVITLADAADPGLLDRVLSVAPRELELEPSRERGVRATLRVPPASARSIRDLAAAQVAEAFGRRARALGIGGSVAHQDGRVAVTLPVADARVIAEVREILGQRGRLAFKVVDDEEDFFEHLSRAPEPDLPRGLSFYLENAPVGPGRSRAVHFARMVPAEGESMAAARRRLEAWLATSSVDADHEIAVGKIFEHDDERDSDVEAGWRTYYLAGKTEMGGEMVRDGRAYPDPPDQGPGGWHVRMELTEAGAARFEALTEQNTKRRFAIVLDGMVESAPVIQSRIPGGVATITVGRGTVEQQRADAKRLELVLLSGALPAPVTLSLEWPLLPSKWKVALDRGLLGATAGMVLAVLVLLIRNLRRGAGAAPEPGAGSP